VDHTVADRRREARFGRGSVPEVRATLRPGCLVSVVDLSAGGALVEAPRPLRPGGRVHLQMVAGQRTFSLAAHILRCFVWEIDPYQGVRYRGALRFDHACDLVGATASRNGSHDVERRAGAPSSPGQAASAAAGPG
jgi:hypothetical protein